MMDRCRRTTAGESWSGQTMAPSGSISENQYRSPSKRKSTQRKGIGTLLGVLHEGANSSPYKKFMPPLVGTAEEIAALGDYLNGMVQPDAAVSAKVETRK